MQCKKYLISEQLGPFCVVADFSLRQHSGGFFREPGTLQVFIKGAEVPVRWLCKDDRMQLHSWSYEQIEELNAYEDIYREREFRWA